MIMNENCQLSIYYNRFWSMPVSKHELYALIQAMLKRAPCTIANFLHINIVDDATIAQINEDYLFCHGPTNILSFPIDNTQIFTTDNDIANIFLSINTLHRECLLYKQKPRTHMLRLFAHAMAHLCHMNHGTLMDKLCLDFYAASNDIP